jgi:hypothetical protein|tara:strand:+ start:1147 stop:1704 length:558 start_codon:yes stop_codon:yes gene_type:complete
MPYLGQVPSPIFDSDITVTNLTTNGNFTTSGTTTLSGNTTVGGTLGVTGATTLSSTLGVTGAVTATGGGTVKATYQERYAAVTSSSGAATLDLSTANYFSHTLSEATTYTFSNPPSSGTAFTFTLELKQNSGGSSYATTWPNSVDWAGGTEPTDSSGANDVDIYVFTTRDGGTTYFGFQSGADLS